MCGICGTVELQDRLAAPGLLQDMAGALRHRGPDATGFVTDRQTGLAHTRLSIIDLAGGRQPMSTADRSLWITFNGEIFNYIELRDELIQKGHRFATRSDTEVILHLYQEEGERCVERLNGQWAFAIWDALQRKLFLSRDRFGVRPLFYTQAGGRFLFTSEIKALLACPDVELTPDLEALNQIFTFWVTLPPRTAFRNVWQLPPGHSLVLQDGRIRVWPYWQLEYGDGGRPGTETSLAEELLALLLDATRIRLRSDVPVAAYLSGGLDSTFITALAKRFVGDRLRTFSVSFADDAFDEAPYQQQASAFLQTQHSDVHCLPEDIARVFPEVVWHAEQPILRTAPAPLFLLSQLVRDSGYKVVLTGEGADELLGGYDIFKETKIRRFWGQQPGSSLRPLLLRRLYPYLEGIRNQPRAYLEKFFCVTPADLANPFFSHLPRWNTTARIKQVFSKAVRAEMETETALSELEREMPPSFGDWTAFHRAEFLETRYLLPGYILSSQGDRMAMAHSVEGRYPFLDHRVAAFAASLPVTLKMKVLDQKHLLKSAAREWIPEPIRRRYKQPYRAPDGASFTGPGTDYAEDLLAPSRIRRDGLFDPGAVLALRQRFRTGRARGAADNMALVGILSTEILLDRFRREPRPDSAAGERLPEEQVASPAG